MILGLDIGNSHIFGGLFAQDKLILQFRYPSTSTCTSDQLGVFLRNVLRENNQDPEQVSHISICSVVPSLDYSVRAAILKYFKREPFLVKIGVKTGLKISHKNPNEIGTDRIVNAVAATEQFPQKDLLIIDLGTATTFDIILADKSYVGGAIIPGMQLAMKALAEHTAQLPTVNIVKPKKSFGQTTISNIQSGIYYSHLGTIKEMISQFTEAAYGNKKPFIVGTGGFAQLFEAEKIFNVIIPDLVLQGLKLILTKNI